MVKSNKIKLSFTNLNNNNNTASYNRKLDQLYACTCMTILFWFEKRSLRWLAVALFVI